MAYLPGIGEPAVYPSSLSPEICQRKAQDCLALAERATDPKQKAAMFRFAEWWMRLAEDAPLVTPPDLKDAP